MRDVASRAVVPLAAVFAVLTAPAAPAAEKELAVAAVVVEPASPAPHALCALKVRLKNDGSRAVSGFALSVQIDGESVPTYDKHIWFVTIDAGATGEISLFNFWSPSPAKSFDVVVKVVDSQCVEVKREGTTATTTSLGPVTGLPVSGSVSVKMSSGK